MRALTFLREESGAAMVEFAIVSAVYFLAFFQLLGFGLFASNNLMAEKATQLAARIAVARPAVDWCDGTGVPERITTSGLIPAPRFGTNCRAGANTCASVASVSCAGSTGDVTANEIWTRIQPMVPQGTVIGDLLFTYTFDANLGYLGDPYTPMVTVELTVANDNPELLSLFSTISRLAQNAGGGAGFNAPQYRVISISLPAEDLNSGTGG